ncbi:ankyrin repeat-containing domain protein [Boeremia exigua]|uniref:ankyrin repeat-containing domain protein n=1 Tax=Boeremia exigua TaxID=749465 RepID=UPI001E8D94B3|nr:ankyrin repeat-containing domain protein [Boeremia exigua]KAH6641940.1 ankyrin repeat-containing domain protein [Boeremia exigua]
MHRHSAMFLPELPNELLQQICEVLKTPQDILSFSQSSRALCRLTEDHMYRVDAQERNSSALLWAAAHGRLRTAEKALKALQGTGRSTESESDDSDLELYDSESGSEADANTTTEPAPNPVGIALVNAAENGHTSLVRLLIEHGAELDWRDPKRKQSAMEAACTKGHIGIVNLLIELGADPSWGHRNRPYPIQCAAMMGHTDIVESLIDAGASADTCTGRPEGGSFPPLQLAVRGDHEETARSLIFKGAKINLRIGRMHTALEEAVRNDRVWAVKMLLASGAMVFAPASVSVRCPALQMARRPGREEMYKLLRDQPVYLWPSGGRCLAQDGSIAARRAEDLRSQEGIPSHLRRSERILYRLVNRRRARGVDRREHLPAGPPQPSCDQGGVDRIGGQPRPSPAGAPEHGLVLLAQVLVVEDNVHGGGAGEMRKLPERGLAARPGADRGHVEAPERTRPVEGQPFQH